MLAICYAVVFANGMATKKAILRYQHKTYTHTSVIFSEKKEGKPPVFLKEERSTFEEKTSFKKFSRKPSFQAPSEADQKKSVSPKEEKNEPLLIRIHLPFCPDEEKK